MTSDVRTTADVQWLPIPGREDLNLPLSQGAIHGNLIVMTQIPQRQDGTLELGDVAAQTRQVLQNFVDELGKVGSSLDQVMTITIYLTDIADFEVMAEVWKEFFPGRGPGRTTMAVAGLTPSGLKVEATAWAVRGSS